MMLQLQGFYVQKEIKMNIGGKKVAMRFNLDKSEVSKEKFCK